MLDMNTVEITKLTSEYAKGKVIFLILGVVIILLSIIFISIINKKLSVYGHNDIRDIALAIVMSLCISGGLSLMIHDHVELCKVTIKVIPTEKLAVEQIQQSDKFIKKDGDYYYVKTIMAPALSSEKLCYSNFDKTINQIKSDFNEDLDSIYYKSKIINK